MKKKTVILTSCVSLQAGIIAPQGIISFCDEIHNDDGVWLRLSEASIKKWCTSTTAQNGHGATEAWALQYNQHLGKPPCYQAFIKDGVTFMHEVFNNFL